MEMVTKMVTMLRCDASCARRSGSGSTWAGSRTRACARWPRASGPLSYSVWERTQAYVRRIQREREHKREVRERPMQFRLVPGQGLLVGWRAASRIGTTGGLEQG